MDPGCVQGDCDWDFKEQFLHFSSCAHVLPHGVRDEVRLLHDGCSHAFLVLQRLAFRGGIQYCTVRAERYLFDPASLYGYVFQGASADETIEKKGGRHVENGRDKISPKRC